MYGSSFNYALEINGIYRYAFMYILVCMYVYIYCM